MNKTYMPGDIVFSKGQGLLAKSIRFLTRSFGESRTKVNHVGIIVEGGDNIADCVIIEALTKVKRHTIMESYGNTKQEVAVYSPTNLTDEELKIILAKAESYVGETYGYLKIIAHLLDWCLLGAYVFRRLMKMDNFPICSWLVACSYSAADKHFGVDPQMATPDDVWDFVTVNGDKYVCKRKLECIQ